MACCALFHTCRISCDGIADGTGVQNTVYKYYTYAFIYLTILNVSYCLRQTENK